jgi:hypothetical protein
MKIEVSVPNGVSGNWSVSSFVVEKGDLSQSISMMKYGRGVPAGTYKRLMRGGEVIMSNTPDEISDFLHFYYKANGSILINGLGLGVLVKALIDKSEVTDITIIENSQDVLNLSGPTYKKEPKVTIIHADCFTWEPPKGKVYDAVWHDIWNNICADNLEEMKKLHRKYGRRARYQESWCRKRCERHAKQSRNNRY